MTTNNGKLPESIVIKLFDQVKDANKQNTESIKDLVNALCDLTRCIEKQPDLNEMSRVCINRGHYISDIIKGIEDLDKNTKKANLYLDKVLKKINSMIFVVLIVFAIMTTSYIVVRNNIEDMVDRKLDNIENVVINERKFIGGINGNQNSRTD